jgi:GT2 family glycosyltransferase
VTQKALISSNHEYDTRSEGQEFPLVSVVITGHNESLTIEKCIVSLFQQTYPNFEIIYIDSKSSDATFEIAARQKNNLRCHANCKRYLALSLEHANSPAKGRNYGVQIASGTIVAFIDADCIPEIDWLEKLIKRFSRDTRVVGGPNILRHYRCSKILDAIDNVLCTYLASGGSAQFMRINKPSYVRALSTSNMAIERKLFRDIGGFDEALRYNEDSDLGYRLRKKGYRLLFIPEAKVNHFMGIECYFDFLRIFRAYGCERGRNVIRRPWLLTNSALLSLACISVITSLLAASLFFETSRALAIYLILSLLAVLFITSAQIGIRNRTPLILVLGPFIYISIYFVYNFSFIGGYMGELTNNSKSRLKLVKHTSPTEPTDAKCANSH